MDSPVMEDHIKFEAEESEQLADHVWEEVIIGDDEQEWKQDIEMEEGDTSADVTMESMASESTESSAVVLDPVTGEMTRVTNEDVTTEPTVEIIDTVETPTPTTTSTSIAEPSEPPTLSPIITQVNSLAPRSGQKLVNINNLNMLSKGSFINYDNKRLHLVTVKNRTLVPGQMVTLANKDNKIIKGKVFQVANKNMLPTKVLTIPGNKTPLTNIVKNKVVPAKVVMANSELKPATPNNKEVTIYITGLAGDKVQIKEKMAMSRLQLAQREADTEAWKSDHIDACLPLNSMTEDVEGEELLATDSELTEGHFLMEGSPGYNTGNLTCNICDRQFTQLKYLLSHQQTHILAEPIPCEVCGKHFKRRYDLLRHKRRAHADDNIYECDICQKTFNDRVIANRHRLTHTEDFKYCCEVCQRPFKYVHDLKRHRSIHYDEKPFECEICGKKFKHKSNLKTHQSTHYSEKPYSCTLCEKRFHQKGNLKTHLIVHTGEMPFVCNVCTKRFHTRSGLLNHSYSHSDEKPFQCEICDKTFNWKSGLLTHQQTHRQRLIPEEVQVIEIGPIPVDPN